MIIDKYYIKWSVIWMIITLAIIAIVLGIFGRLDDYWQLSVFGIIFGADACAKYERDEAQK